jgi:hypothetical protein
MAIMTWAEAIKLAPTNLEAAIHYGAVQEDPIFQRLPFEWWPGGQSVTWTQTTTLGASAWRLVTDAIAGVLPTRTQWVQTLREIYTQMEVPPLHEGSVSNVIDQRAANQRDMSRSIGLQLRSDLIIGEENTSAIGATLTTKGVDGIKFGPGWAAGLVYLFFDDTADTIAISSDGTTYGTAVSVAGTLDQHQVALYDGVAGKTHQYAYITLDTSDCEGAGDVTTINAATGITLTTAKKPAGLAQWIHPDQRIWGTLTTTPTATGDAATLAQLDWGLDMVPGCNLIVTSKRTRRSLKALLAGSADIVTHWMGQALARPMLGYEGIPIWVCDNLPLTESAGVGASGAGLTCGSIYFVRVDPFDGFSTYYWNEGGASVSINDDGVETPVGLPIYYRDLGEISTTLTDHHLRMTGHFCPVLKNTQALAEVHGINN